MIKVCHEIGSLIWNRSNEWENKLSRWAQSRFGTKRMRREDSRNQGKMPGQVWAL